MMWFGFSGARCRSSEIREKGRRQDKSSDQQLEGRAVGNASVGSPCCHVAVRRSALITVLHRAELNRTGGMYEPAAVAPGDRGTGHP